VERLDRTPCERSAVHVSVTTVTTGDQPIENATIIAQEMAGWLEGVDGFQGLIVLSQEGRSLGLTFWDSEELAEKNRPVRLEFLERIMRIADVKLEDMSYYDVMFATVGEGLIHGVG